MLLFSRSSLALVLLASSAVSACPGSPHFVHAKCDMNVVMPGQSCEDVKAEVLARVNGQDGWFDPHNLGTYGIREDIGDSDTFKLTRQTGTVSVGGKNTDFLDLTFTQKGSDCHIDACSESQVVSVYDFSTNYCSLRNLYCGSESGCRSLVHDAPSFSEDTKLLDFSCPFHDSKKCITLDPFTPPSSDSRSASVPSPSPSVSSSSLDVPSPSLDVPSSSLDVPSPSLDVPSPSLDVPSPSLDVPSPSLDVPSPSLDVPSPSLDVPSPTVAPSTPTVDQEVDIAAIQGESGESSDDNDDSGVGAGVFVGASAGVAVLALAGAGLMSRKRKAAKVILDKGEVCPQDVYTLAEDSVAI